jgi:arginine/lysine/ornithine decarboxylase
MHTFYREAGISALQGAQFRSEHLPEMAMPPHAAIREMTRNRVDYLPLDEVGGRIAATLWVVYPPGIATIIPGERLDVRAKPMIDYLKTFERAANCFPGFDTEIQGLYKETDNGGVVRIHTYVIRE